MTTQSIEGAMPPLPEPDHKFVDMEDEDPDILVWRAEKMHTYAKAYAAPLLARVAELQADAARWKAVRDHWKKANFTFRRDPANLLKSINLTVDFDHYAGGGASEIEREFDAALAAHKEQP